MTWDQLVKRHIKEYRIFLTGCKQSFEQLIADKAMLLGQYTEATAPENIRDKIRRDHEAWKQEWELDGQRFKAMQESHQKQINDFLETAIPPIKK